MDGFVFNPNKDIGARPISSGTKGISTVTPELSAFANGEEVKNQNIHRLELNISRIED